MEGPRPQKAAIVAELAERLGNSQAVFVVEYRGLSVSELQELRWKLKDSQAEITIYKNTLARLATAKAHRQELTPLLVGPTALAFAAQDVAGTAKVLRDFARQHPALILKGGEMSGVAVTSAEISSLADLPSREVLLAMLVGGFAAPLRNCAGVLQALPRNLGYGLASLRDRGDAAA